MKRRKLGTLDVSELGSGCMSISANYGPPADRHQGITVIREAHEQGVTFFDTAEVYGPYTSEDLVGEALAPFRNSVRIASKFGFDIEAGGLNSRPDHIKNQTEYSLMERDPERNGVLAACEELGIGFVPWGPVGMGYLPGTMDAHTKFDSKTDLRSGFDRFSPTNLAANRPFVDVLKRFAEKKNATPAQIALAWLLAQKPWIVSIPGTRNLDHLHENLGAINIQLTPADLRDLQTGVSGITAHGGRMNEEQMRVVDQAS